MQETGKIVISKLNSEFADQATVFCRLSEIGFSVKGELRCTFNGKPSRFDLAVVDDSGVSFVVEIKPKRSKKWRAEWLRFGQGKRYAELPVPVYVVCGPDEAKKFVELCRVAYALDNSVLNRAHGVHWIETWAAQG